MFELTVVFVVLVGVAALYLLNSIYLVRQAESIIVERFGRYDRTLTPGMYILQTVTIKT